MRMPKLSLLLTYKLIPSLLNVFVKATFFLVRIDRSAFNDTATEDALCFRDL